MAYDYAIGRLDREIQLARRLNADERKHLERVCPVIQRETGVDLMSILALSQPRSPSSRRSVAVAPGLFLDVRELSKRFQLPPGVLNHWLLYKGYQLYGPHGYVAPQRTRELGLAKQEPA